MPRTKLRIEERTAARVNHLQRVFTRRHTERRPPRVSREFLSQVGTTLASISRSNPNATPTNSHAAPPQRRHRSHPTATTPPSTPLLGWAQPSFTKPVSLPPPPPLPSSAIIAAPPFGRQLRTAVAPAATGSRSTGSRSTERTCPPFGGRERLTDSLRGRETPPRASAPNRGASRRYRQSLYGESLYGANVPPLRGAVSD